MEIRQVSRFHNIGQGLFYSSALYNVIKRKEIRYVIDCGSVNSKKLLKNEIIDFVASFDSGINLDMLIISHLHFDHISGIPDLLNHLQNKKIKIGKIFLPYFDDQTRLFLYIYWLKSIGNEDDFDIQKETWYMDFLKDPLTYLLRTYGDIIDEIIVIMPDDYEGLPSKDNNINSNEENDVSVEGQKVNEPIELNKTSVNHPRIKYMRKCRGSVFGLIEFDFWARPIPSVVLVNFRKASVAAINSAGGLDNLLTQIKSNEINSHPLVIEYKKIIKTLKWNFNDTSLCVSITPSRPYNEKSFILSRNQSDNYKYLQSKLFNYTYSFYPLFSRAIFQSDYYRIRKINSIFPQFNDYTIPRFGYLFTGDLMLKNNKTYKEFFDHYKPKQHQIKLLCVPHHGARSSWNRNLLSDFDFPFSLVSAGEDNSYGHPHFPVVNDLDNMVGWVCVNENNSFNHGICLYFY